MCRLCSSSQHLVLLADKPLYCDFLRNMYSRMNNHGTFCGHFHLNDTVDMHNCHAWPTTDPYENQQMPLHFSHVTIWGGFPTSFVLGPFVSRRAQRCGSCQAFNHRSMMEQFVIPGLQARRCVSTTVFMQNDAFLLNASCTKQVLRLRFRHY
ncbi:hypothetical protein HNY73_023184 [Argiope bruennichi]|uniref:Uncharacterized protein n=1 Tax=Argiope bruennichi TaxID=94029 RepID=A0A8T0E4D8_ARGBR|nr:hypothetical protein HNY73_023184 [Argiope bruennichi]